MQAQIKAALDAADNSEDAVKTKQESILTRIGNIGEGYVGNIYTKKESRLGLSCDPDATRTHDRLLRRQMLYPAELPDRL